MFKQGRPTLKLQKQYDQRGCKCKPNLLLVSLMSMVLTFSLTVLVFTTLSSGQSSRWHSLQEAKLSQPASISGGNKNEGKVEDLVTWILTPSKQNDENIADSAASRFLSLSSPSPLQFSPGSLHLSHVETFQYCYADPSVYSNHYFNDDSGGRMIILSDEYNLAYLMLPKCGSSTSRFMMKEVFHARSAKFTPHDYLPGGSMEKIELITFVREPLSRFYSQYEEEYVRAAPWMRGSRPPPEYPYLYEGFQSYHDYEDAFCPPETRTDRRDCQFRPSQENGTLVSRFERFVHDYDGRTPFGVHLQLSVIGLSFKDGYPYHLDFIYNTSDTNGSWESIAKQREAKIPESGVISGRAYPRRMNSTMVSDETKRRICELALIDYCCLNFPLPSVCLGNEEGRNGGSRGSSNRELYCKLDYDDVKGKVRIQPGSFPEKGKFL